MSNKITDDDLNLSADDNDRLGEQGYGGQEYAGPVRGGAGVKAIFAPANRKRLISYAVAGGLIVVALTWVFVSLDEQDVVRGGTGKVQTAGVQTQSNQTPSAIQRQEAERYNDEILPQEQEKDPTVHPVILTDVESENPFERKERLRTPGKVSEIGQTEDKPRTRASADPEVIDYKGMDDLIRSLIEGEGSSVPALYTVEWDYRAPSNNTNAGALAQVSEAAGENESAGGDSKCSNPATRAATMFMATSDIALNSDVGGPVSLTIRNGKLRGAQLLGQFERKEEWLRMELSTLVTDDHTLPVTAIGLDMETTLNAVQGDVDRHIMYRYGWWGVGTVLAAIGKAAEANSDSDVTITNGAVVETTAASSAREMKMALGALGEGIGAAFQERINRPITVSLNVNDEVGVFFLNDVCLPAGNGSRY